MTVTIGRRELLVALGGAVTWPLAARAQQQAMPVIGFLDGQSFDLHLMTAFRQALKDAGYVEGRNIAIYFRSADGQTDRLVTLAGDIIGRRVAVIITTGGGAAALAAHAATTTIPIVFVNGVDPVSSGLVMSLNRPGGNATGVYIFQQVLEGKRLGLLRELVPSAASIAVLLNPTNANFQTQLRGVQDAVSLADAYRQAALYAGRILKGEKPADLPIVQPTKFEFVINLKTAKTLGLDVPPGLAASADEIVE